MNNRHVALGALVLLLSLLLATPAFASSIPQSTPPGQGVTTGFANLRAGPSTIYAKVGSVKEGEVIRIGKCSADCTWYQLDTGAWIAAFLVEPADSATAAIATPTPAGSTIEPFVTATATTVAPEPTSIPTSGPSANAAGNLRAGPCTSFARVGSVSEGQALTIVGKNAAGDWCKLADGNWLAAFLISNAPADAPVVEADAAPAAAAAPAAPTTAPLQSEPVKQIGPSVVAIGQEIEGNGWRFKVTEVHKRKAVYFYDYSYIAMGHFLIVILEGTNLQSGTDYFFRNLKPYVTDDAANVYNHSPKGTSYATWQYEGLAAIVTDVNPGNFVRLVMVFDIPDNVGHVMLSTDIPKWVDLGDFASMKSDDN